MPFTELARDVGTIGFECRFLTHRRRKMRSRFTIAIRIFLAEFIHFSDPIFWSVIAFWRYECSHQHAECLSTDDLYITFLIRKAHVWSIIGGKKIHEAGSVKISTESLLLLNWLMCRSSTRKTRSESLIWVHQCQVHPKPKAESAEQIHLISKIYYI